MTIVAPGIDTDLLLDRNFEKAISEFGYDRYRFDGNGVLVECRLWRKGDDIASIGVEGPGVLFAAYYALNAAKMWTEE